MQHTTSSTRWLAIFGLLLLLTNAGLYLHLAARLSHFERQAATLQANKAPVRGDAGTGTGNIGTRPGSGAAYPVMDTAETPQILINRMMAYKAQAAARPASSLAAQLDSEMAREPRLPDIEQRQGRLLEEALRRMPGDSPAAEDVKTTCRGRRCLVSAYFGNDSDAREWASDYLLMGGSGDLRRARITTNSVSGNDGLVALQLYLD